MKIIVTDCDHDKMVQEEEVFAKAGMTFTHLACKTCLLYTSRCV